MTTVGGGRAERADRLDKSHAKRQARMRLIFGDWTKGLDRTDKAKNVTMDEEALPRRVFELKRCINQGEYSPLERAVLHRELYEYSRLVIRTNRLLAAPSYPPITLTRSATRRTLEGALRARGLDSWEQAFQQRLQTVSKRTIVAAEVWLGLALWSAISRSTLCDPALVKALRDRLIDPDLRLIPTIGGHLSLRLVVSIGGMPGDPLDPSYKGRYANTQDDGGAKRVYHYVPDGLTLALIHRWLTSGRDLPDRTKTIVTIRRALFGDVKPEKDWRELNHLCRDAIALADDRPNAPCSEALGEVARGTFEASGLDDVGHAVCSGQVVRGKPARAESVKSKTPQRIVADHPNWAVYERVQHAVSRQGNRFPTRTDLSMALTPILSLAHPKSVEHLLVSWFRFLLDDKGLASSSVATYHRRISARLIGTIGGRSLESLDSADLDLIYRDIIDDVRHPATRAQVAGRLAQLQDFGYRSPAHGLPLLAEPIGGADGTRFVRARHIPAEFVPAINNAIARLIKDDTLAATVQAAVILAYRGGLRLGEVAKLRLRDIEPSPEKTLFIVDSQFGTNKTSSSRRQIPFAALLCDQERDAFAQFERYRRRDTPDKLFIIDPKSGAAISDGWLSKTVRLALNHSLGGSAWTFHHLRHAAANNLFLVLEQETDLARGMAAWTEGEQARVRKAVLGDEYARQKRYTALATFIGHASPQVTFESYIHLVEPVMAARRFRQPLALDLANYAAALGIAPSRAAQMSTDGDVAGRVKRKLGQWTLTLAKVDKHIPTNLAQLPGLAKTIAPFPEQCRQALTMLERGATVDEAAQQVNISAAVISRWLENARSLAALRTKYGRPRLFDAERCARAVRNPEIRELLLPAVPRMPIERHDCDLMFAHLRKVLEDANLRPEGEWALNYIIAHADPSKSGLPFRRSADLKRFLAIFETSTFSGARWHLDISRIQPIFAREWMLSLPSSAITSRFHKSDNDIVGAARPKRRTGHARLSLQHPDQSGRLGRGGDAKSSSQTLRYAPHILAIMTGIERMA